MSIFKNIGHVVASFIKGVFDQVTGKPTNGSTAEQIGAAAGQLLGIADPQATALVNAAVTGYGDIVQAVKTAGGTIAAGATITIKVSDALAAASQTIWPQVETLLAAFEGVTAPATTPASTPTPSAVPAAAPASNPAPATGE